MHAGPGVTPGGEVLLRVNGGPKVQRVFEAIDTVDALGIDPADAAPDHWRHVHNRLAANENPRPYTLERHRAWLARKGALRSEEHTSELQSLMRISYAVFCLKKKISKICHRSVKILLETKAETT